VTRLIHLIGNPMRGRDPEYEAILRLLEGNCRALAGVTSCIGRVSPAPACPRVGALISGGHGGDVETLLGAAAGRGVKAARFVDGRGQVRGIVADEAGDAVQCRPADASPRGRPAERQQQPEGGEPGPPQAWADEEGPGTMTATAARSASTNGASWAAGPATAATFRTAR